MNENVVYLLSYQNLDYGGEIHNEIYSTKELAEIQLNKIVEEYLKLFDLEEKYVIRSGQFSERVFAFIDYWFIVSIDPMPVDVHHERNYSS